MNCKFCKKPLKTEKGLKNHEANTCKKRQVSSIEEFKQSVDKEVPVKKKNPVRKRRNPARNG